MKNISEDFALTLTSSSYPSTIVTMLVKSEQDIANLKYFLILNWILNRSTKSFIFELDSTSLHNYPKPKSFCLCGHYWLSAENCTFSQIFIVRGEDSTISDRMGSLRLKHVTNLNHVVFSLLWTVFRITLLHFIYLALSNKLNEPKHDRDQNFILFYSFFCSSL